MIRKAGFTLVELLVVMAIIAILASIAVPNVVAYIKKSRATKAHTEISNIELALTKMVADADRGSLRELFNDTWFKNNIGIIDTVEKLDAAVSVYTRTTYALLRSGRLALQETDSELSTMFGQPVSYNDVLRGPTVQKLGLEYMDLGFDPWGNMYQIFPGPWNQASPRPTPFRIYMKNEAAGQQLPGTRSSGQVDGLTVTGTVLETNENIRVGFSAPLNKMAYIWSYGLNMRNNQGWGTVQGLTGKDAYPGDDVEFMGGGDDISNWDNERSWERLYN